jgi:hypothetical protein
VKSTAKIQAGGAFSGKGCGENEFALFLSFFWRGAKKRKP